MTLAKFNWRALERKWQKKWAWAKVDQTDPDPRRPKYFVTAAYPYPNSPQHIGQARTYTIADANARIHNHRPSVQPIHTMALQMAKPARLHNEGNPPRRMVS